jgi:gluconate 2-dehydrogenase gamma chain
MRKPFHGTSEPGVPQGSSTQPSDDRTISRRRLIGGTLVGAVGAVGASAAAPLRDGQMGAPPREYGGEMPWREGAADSPYPAEPGGFRFFTAAELAFIEPAIDRLIPPDPTGPSATEANDHVFLDRQLDGLFGRGDHFYLGGPWPKGVPEQGYQSRLTPAQLYRQTIPAIERHVGGAYSGKAFKAISTDQQDQVLKGLESGQLKLPDADGQAFFTMFLQNTIEGYFSDPLYGGNKDMAAWKMIGFPGAHYDYAEWALRHGERVPFPPVGIMGRPGWSAGG